MVGQARSGGQTSLSKACFGWRVVEQLHDCNGAHCIDGTDRWILDLILTADCTIALSL